MKMSAAENLQQHFVSEAMLENLPGGYHRCAVEEGLPFIYMGARFLEMFGWTEKEIQERFDNRFLNMVHPEDREKAENFSREVSADLLKNKYHEQIYRIEGKDGYHWVTDTSMQMEADGVLFYQGFVSDITGFILDREKKEKELEQLRMKRMSSLEKELEIQLEQERIQNEVLTALGEVHDAIFRIDLEHDTYIEISCKEHIRHYYNGDPSASAMLKNLCEKIVARNSYKRMTSFFDLNTLAKRLGKKESLETECVTKEGNWHRAHFIVKRRDESGKVTHVLYVTRIIDNEKQYEEHLIARAEYADYANRMKSEFVSQVAHDIRTPMNAIFGFLEIAEANLGNWEKVKYSLGKIRTAGDFLKNLVNDVLDISKMEDGKLKIQPIETDLTAMLENIVETAKAGGLNKKQNIQVNIHHIYHDRIIVDPMRIQQIYDNVLSNAVKYTPDGGSISFTVYEEELPQQDRVRLVAEIADKGIGMSEDFMKKMFMKFEREMDTRINKVSGYGLGLSIVKQLVDLMGGTIEVQSKRGRGTTFWIRLDVPFAEETSDTNVQRNIDYAMLCEGMNLLVAEDNELNREVIEELLTINGITCDCVEDGSLCVEQLKTVSEDTYDAILMDMQMPNLNGVEATKRIRELPMAWAKTIPIFAMTANALGSDIQECLSAGMNQHLSKPLDMKILLKLLAETKL